MVRLKNSQYPERQCRQGGNDKHRECTFQSRQPNFPHLMSLALMELRTTLEPMRTSYANSLDRPKFCGSYKVAYGCKPPLERSLSTSRTMSATDRVPSF